MNYSDTHPAQYNFHDDEMTKKSVNWCLKLALFTSQMYSFKGHQNK